MCRAAILGRSLPPGDLRLRPHFEWASAHFFYDMTRTKRPHDQAQTSMPARSGRRRTPAAGRSRGAPAARRARGRGAGGGACGSRRSPKLRVFLDRPGGVDLELCARVTHHLRDLLARLHGRGLLAGPERPLTKLEHYRRYLGRRVRVRTDEAIEGRKRLQGRARGRRRRGRLARGGLGHGHAFRTSASGAPT